MNFILKLVVVAFWGGLLWISMSLLALLPTWALWNWLMPSLFNLPELTVLQTLGVLLLVGLLFGGRSSVDFNRD